MSRRMKFWGRLATAILALGIVGSVILTIAIGHFASAPAAATIGDGPPELAAENVRIVSQSGATLAGWYVAGRPGAGAVVLLHGVRANRWSMVRRAMSSY